jgi:ATP-dependent Clp protease ATP-binding subunit ClpB
MHHYMTEIEAAQFDDIQYILAIDEIHELDEKGQISILFLVINDSNFNLVATQTLKRWLDEGDHLCIGTTTPRHHGDIVQALDPSNHLADVQVAEPSGLETVNILRGLTPSLIEFHGGELGIDDAAIHQAVNMAKRYLSSTGSLPKSAVQVLDQACALVRTQLSQTSESWQYVRSRRAALQVEITALKVSAMVISIDDLFIKFLESVRSSQSDQTSRSIRRVSERRRKIFRV